MGQAKQYDREYKEEALKLVEEKGCKNASEELGISYHNIQKESRHFDVIISNNEKSVNSITEKAEITYSMVNKLDSLTKTNSNTAKELNKIVDQFR